uniref:Uncharacterized protein n=1 Tax=Micrurus lemniscatus lemniscatus TaxID=129467 RepID=A0A2D4HX59_MICLE
MVSNSPRILLSLFQNTWEGNVLDLSSRNSTKVQLFRSLEVTIANFHAVTCLWFLIFKGGPIKGGKTFPIIKREESKFRSLSPIPPFCKTLVIGQFPHTAYSVLQAQAWNMTSTCESN